MEIDPIKSAREFRELDQKKVHTMALITFISNIVFIVVMVGVVSFFIGVLHGLIS